MEQRYSRKHMGCWHSNAYALPGGPHHWMTHKAKLSYQRRQISLGDADWTLGAERF